MSFSELKGAINDFLSVLTEAGIELSGGVDSLLVEVDLASGSSLADSNESLIAYK